MEIEVKGHSGCNIEIVKRNNSIYLEKSTFDKKYVKRLYNQATKQKEASKNEYQYIRVPEIFDIEMDEDKMVMRMEYVYSKNFIDHFENAGFEQINYFIKAFDLFIRREVENSEMKNLSFDIISDKWKDVKIKITDNKHISSDIEVNEIVKKVDNILKDNSEKICIPVGVCHGDLTFSNILFNGNNYYLIDFLDSFIESPIMDMVKLRQDTAHLWSPLMYIGNYDSTRLNIICNKIDNELDKCFRKYDWYCKYYNVFQLLNFMRILQYAHDEDVIKYLKNEINDLICKTH